MIKTRVRVPIDYTAQSLREKLSSELPLSLDELSDIRILRRALSLGEDKREYILDVGLSLDDEREAGLLKMKKKFSLAPNLSLNLKRVSGSPEVVVVGAGPAGLFAALCLAEAGFLPIVIERGSRIDKRQRAVVSFFLSGELDTECNIQFGEGGAGAFSDGKLKVGSLDKYNYKVLSEFVLAGANEEIIYSVGAHLGTDRLYGIIERLREKIISLGGRFIYDSRVSAVLVRGNEAYAVEYESGGRVERIDTNRIIFAIGHSARDSFSYLHSLGVPMEARGFGIGVRVEHPREYIDALIYGNKSDASRFGTASYHLVSHTKTGRSLYSFCMCPGGVVVPSASEEGGVVTNGMSDYARMADNSNSALLVSVSKEDFRSDHPLSGFLLQEKIEKVAYLAGGGGYKAPVCRMEDFLLNKPPRSVGSVKPSYKRGTELCAPSGYLPPYITETLRLGLSDFDAWLPGFIYPDALLTGAETRTTCPVRIKRSDSFEAEGFVGLYFVGEGAGYSGGIVSSAKDAVECAESIIMNYK